MTAIAEQRRDRGGRAMQSVARIAFGVFFAGSAVLKYFAATTEMQMMRDAGFVNPLPLYVVAAMAQLVLGTAVIIDRFTRPAALGLVLYVAVISYYLHPFWMLTGEAWSIQFQLFTKNLGIMAGLLAVAGAAAQ